MTTPQFRKMTSGALMTAVVVSATIGCGHNRASETGQGAEQLASRPDALIQMRRGGCPPGVCPVYSVSIFPDGTVAYDGQANVAVLGHRTAKVSAERLNDLLTQLEAMDFLDSPEQCCVCPDATDGAHLVILDYRPGATDKTVLHDDACGLAPPTMTAIESSIDQATGVERWITPFVASKQ